MDKLQVEKERGITVKAQTASMFYEYKGKRICSISLILPAMLILGMKFPVHSMHAKEHCFLVDAAQGVEAQTMANFYLAFDQDLTIVPVINKIDMAAANPERVAHRTENFL